MARGFATHTSRMFIKAWKALNYNRIEEEVVSKSLSGPLECSGSSSSHHSYCFFLHVLRGCPPGMNYYYRIAPSRAISVSTVLDNHGRTQLS